MTLPYHLALRLLFLVVIILFCIVIVIHDLPDESAKRGVIGFRRFSAAGWVSPFTRHALRRFPRIGATGLGLRRPSAGRGARRIDAAVKRQEERLALLERGRRGDAE